MNSKSKEHEHSFVAEKYTVQESKNEYIGNSRYQAVILDVEKVLLFCKGCGKKIEATEASNDTE